MLTHCTITRFRFRARQIDGVKCGLFSNHAPLGQIILRVGRVGLSVLCNCLCTVIVLCEMMMMMTKGSEKVKPGADS